MVNTSNHGRSCNVSYPKHEVLLAVGEGHANRRIVAISANLGEYGRESIQFFLKHSFCNRISQNSSIRLAIDIGIMAVSIPRPH